MSMTYHLTKLIKPTRREEMSTRHFSLLTLPSLFLHTKLTRPRQLTSSGLRSLTLLDSSRALIWAERRCRHLPLRPCTSMLLPGPLGYNKPLSSLSDVKTCEQAPCVDGHSCTQPSTLLSLQRRYHHVQIAIYQRAQECEINRVAGICALEEMEFA